ncbi:MAG TPA: PIN domain-containing protein [Segetibacter sp.]
MRIVLDTNILLQALAKKSRIRTVWDAYLTEKYHLLVTSAVLFEYEEKIAEKTSEYVAFNVVSLISEAVNSIFIKVDYEWNVITADPDDNKFLIQQ